MLRLSQFIFVLASVAVATSFIITERKSAINWPFTVCGSGPWKMTSLTLSAQPSRNSNNEIVASGNVNGYVEFDHVELDVKINGLFLHSESVSYGGSYDSGDILTFKYDNFVPSFAPAGTYLLTFSFKDKNNAAAGCFQLTFKL